MNGHFFYVIWCAESFFGLKSGQVVNGLAKMIEIWKKIHKIFPKFQFPIACLANFGLKIMLMLTKWGFCIEKNSFFKPRQ